MAGNPGPGGGEHEDGAAPVIRDRRRLDPETGQVRDVYAAQAPVQEAPEPGAEPGPASVVDPGAEPDPAEVVAENVELEGILADLDSARSSSAERLADLQRLQAEFMNYRRRVERDRDLARDQAVAAILEALLPVLDDINLARQHGDLEGGPFAAIAEKLENALGRLGLARYGEPGEAFDPSVHEALMHTEAELAEGTTTTTVVQVLQPGYKAGEKVLRPARVAVADPA